MGNRDNPTNCRITYDQCPSDTDLLLNYFNNHNGGLFQNTLPSVTNEVGSLFPGLNNLPQIAASTFGDTIQLQPSQQQQQQWFWRWTVGQFRGQPRGNDCTGIARPEEVNICLLRLIIFFWFSF